MTYHLAKIKTYATLKRCYRAGELFTAEEVGDLINEVDDEGNPVFVEAISKEVPKESASAKPATATKAGKIEVKRIGGVDPDRVTV